MLLLYQKKLRIAKIQIYSPLHMWLKLKL